MVSMLWLSLCSVLLCCLEAKDVRVTLKAGWHGGPLVAEVAEFLWETRPVELWPFLETLSAHAADASDIDCWAILLGVEEKQRQKHLAVSLGLRVYAPKVEMRRQLAGGSHDACCRAEIQTEDDLRVFTDVQTLIEFLEYDAYDMNRHDVRHFDFMYDRSEKSVRPTVILYAPIGAQCFLPFHDALIMTSSDKGFQYIYRPVDGERCQESMMHPCARFGTGELKLSGFGVELALKNTEYIAMDDAAQGSTPMTEISESEDIVYESLGLQTMQQILQSDHPMQTATDILQDFPSHAAALAKVKVTKETSSAVKEVSKIVMADRSFLLLNGMSISMQDPDFMEFWDRLNSELAASEQLRALNISESIIPELLKLRAKDKTEELKDVRFNILPRNHIIFFNDIERDSAYKQYYKSLDVLLSPYVRGGLVPIRKNLFNVVFFVQLGSDVGLEAVKLLQEFMDQTIPIRMGIIPLLPSWCGQHAEDETYLREKQIARYFLTLYLTFHPRAALKFWTSIEEYDGDLSTLYASTYALEADPSMPDAETAAQRVSSKTASYLKQSLEFVEASGMCLRSQPSMWLNGRLIDLEPRNVYRTVLYQIRLETQFLQQMVYLGELTDADKDILQAILRKTPSFNKYSPYIEQDAHVIQSIILTDAHFDESLTVVSNPRGHTHEKSVRHWIVGSANSNEALDTIRSALMFMMSPSGATSQMAFRLTFGRRSILRKLWSNVALDKKGQESESIAFWIRLLSHRDAVDALLGDEYKMKKLKEILTDLCTKVECNLNLSKMTEWELPDDEVEAGDMYGVKMDGNTELTVISNGRVIKPSRERKIPANTSFLSCSTVEDFEILHTIAEKYQIGGKIRSLLDRRLVGVDADRVMEISVRAAAILSKYRVSPTDASTLQSFFKRVDTRVMFQSNGDNNALVIHILLNPISSIAQRWMPIFKWLDDVFSAKISIFLHPTSFEQSMPIKQYYRLALPQPIISETGHIINIKPPEAHFKAVPERTLLTLNPDTPSAWLIEPLVAKLDLDNLRMMDLKEETLYVEYGLESILVTGTCLDTTAKSRQDVHPRGLQLTLGKEGEAPQVDTLVMSNLGYFQLKSSPGIWNLSLAEGRSKDLYCIDPQTMDDPSVNMEWIDSTSTALTFVMDSFFGKQLILRVQKRPGHESEDVLSVPSPQPTPAGPLMDAVLRLTGFKKTHLTSQSKQQTLPQSNWDTCEHADDPVHIFTIASGHMYERLQKIMILSVLKHTKSCVKFWFIKNDMSPQIKDFLPHFARKYKFEYGLITYKWPTWLHHQKEKQRKIWAYKILFLDVLFPLSMRRVLFLDSDQIIRTDIRMLYDMDIKGAPLAYTPFCDNNKEMNPFRFWKGGFWENHLEGKPYHISALYVVDLIKFRQMAAGDHLRVVYEQLSKDPNSLSNLDQDLPNYTQHEVPIFSLPQEWLWCESWCGNDTKHLAKTIDLCNNPKTKEPKLQAARRIVAEWSDLDEEARNFTDEVMRQKGHHADEVPLKESNHDTTEL